MQEGASTQGREQVVLIHGIWFRGQIMLPLAARLQKHGFETHCFSYPSVTASPAENADALYTFAQSLRARRLHFVAHSLGGVVVLNLFHRHTQIPPGRVVLLGTPVQGSLSAQRIQALPFGDLMLGRSVEQGLLGDVPAWQGGRDLGMIAGTVGFGLGSLLGRMPEVNDGAVLVSETELPGLTDRLCLPTTHTGMLLSSRVAYQVAFFLKNGHFSM